MRQSWKSVDARSHAPPFPRSAAFFAAREARNSSTGYCGIGGHQWAVGPCDIQPRGAEELHAFAELSLSPLSRRWHILADQARFCGPLCHRLGTSGPHSVALLLSLSPSLSLSTYPPIMCEDSFHIVLLPRRPWRLVDAACVRSGRYSCWCTGVAGVAPRTSARGVGAPPPSFERPRQIGNPRWVCASAPWPPHSCLAFFPSLSRDAVSLRLLPVVSPSRLFLLPHSCRSERLLVVCPMPRRRSPPRPAGVAAHRSGKQREYVAK